jgi:flagellar FliL protein
MAEAEEKKDEGGAPKKGKSKLVIALVAVVALGGLGGGAYVMLGSGGGAEAAKHESADAGHGEGAAAEAVGAADAIVALDTFVVNMADENAQRYLKVTMKVEFFGEKVPVRFSQRRPQIRDLLLSLLGSKTVADVRTIEGKQQLRDEVIARISRVLEDDSVKAVYFAEFIVQ